MRSPSLAKLPLLAMLPLDLCGLLERSSLDEGQRKRGELIYPRVLFPETKNIVAVVSMFKTDTVETGKTLHQSSNDVALN
jgi:hypothetical protein